MEMGLLTKKLGGKKHAWIAGHLPQPVIIPQPGKIAAMDWIWKVFGRVISFWS